MTYDLSSYFTNLQGDTSNSLYKTGALKMVSGFASAYGANINYSLLKAALTNQNILANTYAQNIETRAIEEANIMRGNFNIAAGSQIQNAAARGIKTTSGMVQDSLERSAMSMGQDIQKLSNNAKRQADAIKFNAWANTKIAKIRGKAQMISSYANSIGQVASGVKDIFAGATLGG